jgi:hypothetical protein
MNNQLTIKSLISLIENFPSSWSALPQQIKDMMIASPDKFQLSVETADKCPNIIFNDVVFKWQKLICSWVWDSIFIPTAKQIITQEEYELTAKSGFSGEF